MQKKSKQEKKEKKSVTFRLVQQHKTDLQTGIKITENVFMPITEVPEDSKILQKIFQEFTNQPVLVSKQKSKFDIGGGELIEKFKLENLVQGEEGDIEYKEYYEDENGEILSEEEYDDEEFGDFEEEEKPVKSVYQRKKIQHYKVDTTNKKRKQDDEDEEEIDDEEEGWETEEEEEKPKNNVKETKPIVKFVGKENKEIDILNQEFEKLLKVYDQEEEEQEQELVNKEELENCIEDLLNNPDYTKNGYSWRTHSTFVEPKESKLVSTNDPSLINQNNPNNVVPKDEIIDIILKRRELESSDEEEEDILAPYLKEKEKEWDCESIISTYTDTENHPTIIKEDGTKKIKLSQKSGLPLNVLPKIEKKIKKEKEEEEVKEKKKETKEEKKKRKKEVKEEKRMARIEKKETKKVFKKEETKQQKLIAIPEVNQRVVVKY